LTVCSSYPFFHHQSILYSPSFSSATFPNFQGISDLFSQVPNFQHYIKPCTKCTILLGYHV
jgi:hypothetical protein